MRLLSISTDKKIFDRSSSVAKRMVDYGNLFDELHVVVFSKGYIERFKLSENVWVYPTNSKNRWTYILDAYKISKTLKVDSVTSQDPFETGLVGFLMKRYNPKLFFHVQVHTNFFSPYFRKQSILNRLRISISKVILPKADAIRVVSRSIKESLLKSHISIQCYPLVLPVFVPSLEIAKNSEKRYFKKQFLVVSRIEPEKNIDLLSKSFSKIAKEFEDVGMVVVGDGSLRKEMEDYFIKENVISKVRFVGWQDDVYPYYASSDVFLLMSDYEGYNRSLIEAAYSKLAIISTSVSPACDDLKEAVVIVKKDEKDIVSAMRTLVKNEEFVEDIAEKAYVSAKRVEISKDKYMSLYKGQFLNEK
ncbi:MAG: glycosyltransferase family 4 protein [Candidatus Pacebacteria bacterium]|nr:glycosyltransferase family 4 protein [Candidatus Paceibacterota bacterium]